MREVGGILKYKILKSTNDEARRLIEEIDNLSVITTESQPEGRGQGDHTWYSTPGKNLTFTFVLKYEAFERPLKATDAILITCLTTLALRSLLLQEGIEARIKWPNDIWVGDRKICGILIENILDGENVSRSIVGVGLDVNEEGWPEDLPNPVSMLELTGKTYDRDALLERLHKEICRHAEMLDSDDGRKYLQEEFGKYVFRLS